MTYEEALKYAKGGLEVYLRDYPELTTQIEFQKLGIEALEKQIPKKPFVDYYGDLDCMCPTCHRVFKKIRKGKMFAHCPDCGRALDWSEVYRKRR